MLGRDHPRTAHDHVFLHGALPSGAIVNIAMRGGPAFKYTPAIDWRILCQSGEIRFTADVLAIQIRPQNAKIEVFDYVSGEVTHVEYKDELDAKNEVEEDAMLNMEPTKRVDEVWKNVARIYAAIARDDKPGEGTGLVGFDTAVKRQVFLQRMLAGKHY